MAKHHLPARFSRPFRYKLSVVCLLLAGLLIACAAPSPVQAQEAGADSVPGEVRIQNRTANAGDGDGLLQGPSGPLLDFRQEMRTFIQRIATYARQYRSRFPIFVENGLELLIKRNAIEETQTSPARRYMRSIDGVIATNIYTGENLTGAAAGDDELRAARIKLLETAKQNGLRVLVLDQADDPTVIEQGRGKANQLGYVYHAREANSFVDTTLPRYPSRPFDENSRSIVSEDAIRNFVVVGNSAAYGRQDEFTLMMRNNNYDLVIVDVFHGRRPLTKQAVATLKYKASGARRFVFAQMNIGVAASYRHYWQPNWREGSPPWIGTALRGEPDHYFVEFWRPEWQRVITGDTASYIYGIIDQGYDGIVIGGADMYEIFEGGDAAEARLAQ